MDKYLRCITQALGLMIILGGFFNNEPIYLFIGTLVVVVFEILSIYYKENRFMWATLYGSAVAVFFISYFALTSSSDNLIQEVLGYEPELFPKTQKALTILLIYEYVLYFLGSIFSIQALFCGLNLLPVLYDRYKLGIKESCEEMTIKLMNVFYPFISLFALYSLYISLFPTQIIKNESFSYLSYQEPETKISLLKTKVYLISKYFDLLTFDKNNGRCQNLTQSKEIDRLSGKSFIYISKSKNNDEISIDKNKLDIPEGFKEKFDFFVNFGKIDNNHPFRIRTYEIYKPDWERYKCNSI